MAHLGPRPKANGDPPLRLGLAALSPGSLTERTGGHRDLWRSYVLEFCCALASAQLRKLPYPFHTERFPSLADLCCDA